MASPTIAANAYANLAKLTSSAAVRAPESGGPSFAAMTNLAQLANPGAVSAPASGGPSFAAMVKDVLGSVMETGRKSDAQTVAMASGKANVMDVVTAVADTDVAVSTLVSVRDRVIQSYEDILKMPI
jgi:flagellar hook-basal body complex protein FliE